MESNLSVGRVWSAIDLDEYAEKMFAGVRVVVRMSRAVKEGSFCVHTGKVKCKVKCREDNEGNVFFA